MKEVSATASSPHSSGAHKVLPYLSFHFVKGVCRPKGLRLSMSISYNDEFPWCLGYLPSGTALDEVRAI